MKVKPIGIIDFVVCVYLLLKVYHFCNLKNTQQKLTIVFVEQTNPEYKTKFIKEQIKSIEKELSKEVGAFSGFIEASLIFGGRAVITNRVKNRKKKVVN